ncbi:hypothetical protein [Pseudomonas sp. FEMGT703P]|uniref:hypothetical protein n=1 Tax=Pseudomonas sp. FEMGT703P TaxID=2080764 RepID=UPI00259D1B48|nr:hypothetical protein [Pseudomonas sp. FEMGT703P]
MKSLTQEANSPVIPFFDPQGTILPSSNGMYELSSFTFVPNALFRAEEPQVGAPASVKYSEQGLGHVTLPLSVSGSLEHATEFQGKPVSWLSNSLALGKDLTHVAVYVVLEGYIVATRVVNLEDFSSNSGSAQRLSALQDAVAHVGQGVVDPVRLLVKMKDSGF